LGEGDEGVDVAEAEAAAGDESDLGVDGFDEGVGESAVEGVEDRFAVAVEPVGEVEPSRVPCRAYVGWTCCWLAA
jgi:hypothetical protein